MKKNFLRSMTIQGVGLTAGGIAGIGHPLAIVLSLIGVPMEPAEMAQIIDSATVIIGLVMTVIGRMRATEAVTLGKGKK